MIFLDNFFFRRQLQIMTALRCVTLDYIYIDTMFYKRIFCLSVSYKLPSSITYHDKLQVLQNTYLLTQFKIRWVLIILRSIWSNFIRVHFSLDPMRPIQTSGNQYRCAISVTAGVQVRCPVTVRKLGHKASLISSLGYRYWSCGEILHLYPTCPL